MFKAKKNKFYQVIKKNLFYFGFENFEKLQKLEKFFSENFSVNSKIYGRTQVLEINVDDKIIIVRKYRRGGLTGRILKSTYFHKSRFFQEFFNLNYLVKNNFNTTQPAFAIIKQNKIGYSGVLATYKLVNYRNLFELLQTKAEFYNKNKTEILSRIFFEIVKLYDLKVYHTDFQVKNILMNLEKNELSIIDFDKSKITSKKCIFNFFAMYYRFLRSLKKQYKVLSIDKFSEDMKYLDLLIQEFLNKKTGLKLIFYRKLAELLFFKRLKVF